MVLRLEVAGSRVSACGSSHCVHFRPSTHDMLRRSSLAPKRDMRGRRGAVVEHELSKCGATKSVRARRASARKGGWSGCRECHRRNCEPNRALASAASAEPPVCGGRRRRWPAGGWDFEDPRNRTSENSDRYASGSAAPWTAPTANAVVHGTVPPTCCALASVDSGLFLRSMSSTLNPRHRPRRRQAYSESPVGFRPTPASCLGSTIRR